MDDIENPPEPQNLRVLRILVTVLTVVMIVGFVILVATFVIRLQPNAAQTPAPQPLLLPPEIPMPKDSLPLAFTRGPDWIAITTPDSILIYSLNGELQQTVAIRR